MTLNDLERRDSPYFAFFFTELDRFSGRFHHSGWRQTYNVRKILFPSSSLVLLAKTIMHPAARSLCNSWASCYCCSYYLRWINRVRMFLILIVLANCLGSSFVIISFKSLRHYVNSKMHNYIGLAVKYEYFTTWPSITMIREYRESTEPLPIR